MTSIGTTVSLSVKGLPELIMHTLWATFKPRFKTQISSFILHKSREDTDYFNMRANFSTYPGIVLRSLGLIAQPRPFSLLTRETRLRGPDQTSAEPTSPRSLPELHALNILPLFRHIILLSTSFQFNHCIYLSPWHLEQLKSQPT